MADVLFPWESGYQAPAIAAPPPSASSADAPDVKFPWETEGAGTASADAGPLSNTGDEGWTAGALKGAGTAVVKGLTDIPAGIGALEDYLFARGESAITGEPYQDVAARHTAQREQVRKDQASMGLPDVSQQGILAKTGEYQPTTELGRLGQAGLETAVGAMTLPGASSVAPASGVLSTAGTVAKNVLPNVASGVAAQGATDLTGNPYIGMAAGVLTPMAAEGAIAGATKAMGPQTAASQEAKAAQMLRASATDPAKFESDLNPTAVVPGASSPVVPGSKPTTGQLTGDLGVLDAERQSGTANNIPFNERAGEQNTKQIEALGRANPQGEPLAASQMFQTQLAAVDQATQAAVDRLSQNAQGLAAHLGPGAAPEDVGATIRTATEVARAAAKAERNRFYNAVDPNGDLNLVAQPITQRAGELTENLDPLAAPMQGEERSIFDAAARLPQVVPFRSLVAFDQRINAALKTEKMTAGESPVWGRLSQLKGATQSAINNAVDNQEAFQQRAVAAGTMQPENTITANIQRIVDDWQARRSNAASAVTPTDTGSTSVPGVSGATRQAGPGLGSPPGGQSVPPPLEPNFDPAAAARLAAAKASHADYAQTYREGPVAPTIKTQGFATNYNMPTSGVPARAFVPGDKGYETLQAFSRATNNSPDALAAIADYAVAPLRRSLGANGTVDPAAFARWQQTYAPALRALNERIPGFTDRFANASAASDAIAQAARERADTLRGFQLTQGAKFLGKTAPSEVENTLGTILTGKQNGPTQMRALVNQTGGNADTIAGLRTAGINWMTRTLSNAAEAGTTGNRILSPAKFPAFVRENAATLRELYTPEQVNTFRAVAADLERANRSVTATAIKGSPGTAKDVKQFIQKATEEKNAHSSFMTALLAGAYAGHEAGGIKGAVVGAGSVGLAHVVNVLRKNGIEKAQDIYREALLNPEVASALLRKVPKPSDNAAWQRAGGQLQRALTRTAITAPVAERAAAPQFKNGGSVKSRSERVKAILEREGING